MQATGAMNRPKFGAPLEEGDLESFSGEQIVQLYELYQESSKPPPMKDDTGS